MAIPSADNAVIQSLFAPIRVMLRRDDDGIHRGVIGNDRKHGNYRLDPHQLARVFST
jgi:hypothetical protein